jgi:phage shock protein PspC (stress-responsive transcriptional regulator)
MKKLYKIEQGKKIAGVCGGIAEYFNWDVSIVRVAAAVIMFAYGTGLLAYIAAAVILPKKSDVI